MTSDEELARQRLAHLLERNEAMAETSEAGHRELAQMARDTLSELRAYDGLTAPPRFERVMAGMTRASTQVSTRSRWALGARERAIRGAGDKPGASMAAELEGAAAH